MKIETGAAKRARTELPHDGSTDSGHDGPTGTGAGASQAVDNPEHRAEPTVKLEGPGDAEPDSHAVPATPGADSADPSPGRRDGEIAMLTAAGTGALDGLGGGGGERSALAQKWAPDSFSGEPQDWRDWSLKFKSYMSPLHKGHMGRWMQKVDEERAALATLSVLGESAQPSASSMCSALIATCQGKSLVITEKAGPSEGLEAWRQLLLKYEARSRQTRVMRLLEVLPYDFKSGEMLDSLENFERLVGQYEKESGKTLDDDLKIGIVIRGIEKGSLREHLLLHSERADTYDLFRQEVDTIARAQSTNLMQPSPMDLSAFNAKAGRKGGGKGDSKTAKFEGTCNNCHKVGHKRADCRAPGGGAATAKPGGGAAQRSNSRPPASGGKNGGCFKCGMTNHFAKDCKSSEEKCQRYKQSQGNRGGGGGKGLREVSDEPPASEQLGAMYLCQMCGPEENLLGMPDVRDDRSDRLLRFRVDTAACRTVVPITHRATRGYKTYKDTQYGAMYGTAKAKGPKIQDKGLRVLQTAAKTGDMPTRLRTRSADVSGALIAVCDLVDNDHKVVFDKHEAYAEHKATGRKSHFQRQGRGWDFTVELEAPNHANEVMSRILAEVSEETKVSKAPSATTPGGLATIPEEPEFRYGFGEHELDRTDPLFRMAAGQ